MSFLRFTLSGESAELKIYLGLNFSVHAPGVIEWRPEPSVPSASAKQVLVISCGLHGNETAPIEIVDQLVDDIVRAEIVPKIPVLFVIGNPAAIAQDKRFVEHNLNRLFSVQSLAQTSRSAEHKRAAFLAACVRRFFAQFSSATLRLHYDLHSAIRRSKIEKFAVYPYLHGGDINQHQLSFLDRCGIRAVLLSHQPAGTFSYFSSRQLSAQAFTIELGRVKPFGQNELSQFKELILNLTALLEGREDFSETEAQLQMFSVVEEDIKRSDHLQLHIPSNAENFTEYPVGTVLASDRDYEYRTQREGERFVFPIRDVPVGQRAMLVVAPAVVPGAAHVVKPKQ